ncbi:MAG: hypothetical protein WCK32_03100 [Chlorobiaceae bacterium]
MNPNLIESSEVLFRAVQEYPHLWKGNRPSSLIFRHENGVSVDRDGDRTDDEVCDFLQSNLSAHKLKAIVSVTAEQCKEIDVLAVPREIESNPYHAEIHDSETKMLISKAKARSLAISCRIVKNLSD